jgi:uncharacterized protein YbcI
VVFDPEEASLESAMAGQREAQSPEANVSREAVQILRQYSGRGPTKARTAIGAESVTVVLADALTPGERTLAEGGNVDAVLDFRHQIQLAMRDDLVAMVERNLDRKVLAFMSDNHVDPDMGVEVFVLAPAD